MGTCTIKYNIVIVIMQLLYYSIYVRERFIRVSNDFHPIMYFICTTHYLYIVLCFEFIFWFHLIQLVSENVE